MHYVYVIKQIKDDIYYIGYTSDLKRRFKEHNAGQECKLIYYESYLFDKSARQRERSLKQYGGAWRSLRKRLNLK
ncbi:MAG: hypothetical protein A2648_01705 [Candidatus Lloydbacteria bacterium RIFCSPHIGHO2_01_FULL_41_20]|uniref:GIY-YIG domain-containing protein n=1 Tax=Candidatus Lloydbacteria bacterium RIFCSPHIGHO2_01_FULL_41_20 TaxID=1798657 RepID=A0A1G2CT76_9BACT|nr:MAG: hypothetical protein A2648_01705 [Candidatus Lloydbacteria bacterium RIFCSPHIGHO2_01_FULL_41_20]